MSDTDTDKNNSCNRVLRTTWFLEAKASEVVQVEKGLAEALAGTRGDGQEEGSLLQVGPGS